MAKDFGAVAARCAYMYAISCGAVPHIAFDIACASYRAINPTLREDKLRFAVSRMLAEPVGEPLEPFA